MKYFPRICLALTTLSWSGAIAQNLEEPTGATDAILINESDEAAADQGVWRFTSHWENDGSTLNLLGDSSDRYYTNGAGFTLALHSQFAVDATNWIPFADSFDQSRRAVGFTAGQLMFTPQDLTLVNPDPTDRPYAGYLYAGFFFQRANDQTLDHIQIDIGIVGNSSLADSIQIAIHDFSGEVDPQGWNSQIEDEPTIQVYLRKKWRFDLGEVKLNDIPPIQFQIIPEAELAVGTVYRHARAGIMFRTGFHLPDDFGPDQLTNIGSFTSPQTLPGWGGYLFTRLSGKAVEHNLFLEGNTWKDSAGVDEEPFIGEAQFGIGLQFRCTDFSIDITYSQMFVTKEFKGQDGHHSYGTISCSLTWRF